MESDFEKVPGVLKVVSGYTGGTGENPTYETYARQGHIEAVQIFYDPMKVTYAQLLDVFWRHIDPTDGGGQFVDRGPQYRSAIFYHDEQQKQVAEQVKKKVEATVGGLLKGTTKPEDLKKEGQELLKGILGR